MTQHLVVPQFLRGDLLARDNEMAQKSLSPLTIAGMQEQMGAQVTPPVHPNVVKQWMEQMGLPEEVVKAAVEQHTALYTKTVTDPLVLLQPYTQPTDFTAQYPQPLDPSEVLLLCEEVNVYRSLPEVVTPFNADSWREMDVLQFDTTGEANDGFFAKGSCPDTITHDGDNRTVTRRYIGAQGTMSFEDIKHSAAVAQMPGYGINALLTQNYRRAVADAKAKEMALQEIMTINKWDLALVKGSNTLNALAFDGMETQVTQANGARINADPTGTFDIETFDNFLNAGCARATHIYGHPKALEAIKKGYLSLGATGGTAPIVQLIITKDGEKVVPGFVLADQVDTSIGRVTLVPDFRFTTIQVQPDRFHSTVYPLRLYHNGEPIVYKSTQTPLSFKDLAPGCTAISFLIYAVTSLVIKHMCAQSAFTANWPGVVGTGCNIVGGVDL